jgi:beta-galactosidase GanA
MNTNSAKLLPRLVKQGSVTFLEVEGQPFFIRGGELGNSSAELSYAQEFWPKFTILNLNTVLAPVYWELIEPVEGQFVFTMVDDLLAQARSQGLRLVLLWFGSWKNSMSSYVPGWVKQDAARFERARTSAGEPLEILSAFRQANWEADATAFAALCAHLREVDPQHIVVMLQVENEIGHVLEPRDHCSSALEAYRQAVPPEVLAIYSHCVPERDSLTPWKTESQGGHLPRVGETVGFLTCAEGRFAPIEAQTYNYSWQHLRYLNGDQTHQGRHIRLEPGRFTIQKFQLYRYQ